ncbi:flagellar hook assembly protein FlgD [Halobacillus sp. A1]|uniref:flagellar hook assembly protein FlgD n=1 Tax=Halobacillus sp. A1 TaxID=2880262 RepID=UPI0020A6B8DB|nr:flagellar hook assembly protein FlgD [Halobacillus sp. A1]MCP3031198.1 flagellar hook assembly protein FlgD [Halobacillus sp. A1]
MTSIDPSYYLNNQPRKSTGSSDLGKDDFLKILMAQLQNQNPLDPMEDKEFVSQMAQFSSLEQMTNMSQMMEKFTNNQSPMPVIQYSGLIGKEVTYPEYDQETGAVSKYNAGKVQSVSQADGEAFLTLDNGAEVAIEDINKVAEANV